MEDRAQRTEGQNGYARPSREALEHTSTFLPKLSESVFLTLCDKLKNNKKHDDAKT